MCFCVVGGGKKQGKFDLHGLHQKIIFLINFLPVCKGFCFCLIRLKLFLSSHKCRKYRNTGDEM